MFTREYIKVDAGPPERLIQTLDHDYPWPAFMTSRHSKINSSAPTKAIRGLRIWISNPQPRRTWYPMMNCESWFVLDLSWFIRGNHDLSVQIMVTHGLILRKRYVKWSKAADPMVFWSRERTNKRTVLPTVPWHLKRCKRYYPPTSQKSYSPQRWRRHNLRRHPWHCWTTSQCGPKRSSSGCRWWQSWSGYLVVQTPPDKTNCSTVYIYICVCVWLYIYIYTYYTHMYTYIYVYLYVYNHVYTYVLACVYVYEYVYVYAHV